MIVQQRFQEDLMAWLVRTVALLETPSGESVLHLLRRSSDPLSGMSSEGPERFAHDIISELQELDPLLPATDVKRHLRNRFWLLGYGPGSKLFQEGMTLLWNKTLDEICRNGWHARQWVAGDLVSQSDRVGKGHECKISSPMQSCHAEPEGCTSRLLSLPGEIRNLIWRFATLQASSTQMEDAGLVPVLLANGYRYTDVSGRPKLQPATPPPALLDTSRQVRSEVLPIYYAENQFSIALDTKEAFDASLGWVNSLADRALTSLSGIVLQGLVMRNRSPVNFGGLPPRSMRIFVGLQSLTTRHEAIADVDQSKELSVVEHTLASIRRDLDGKAQLSAPDFRLIIQNFARCCATFSGENPVPLLADGSQFDKLEARAEQADFINRFCEDGKDTMRDVEYLDLGQTRFSIW